jgi:Zn finger protein HypA/HybF involved in hydrogenase expression
METKILAIFHCDNCGRDIEMVTIPNEEIKMFCPRCGSNKNFYVYDDAKITIEKKKLF